MKPTEGFHHGRARLRWLLVVMVLLAVMPVFALYFSRLQANSEMALQEARERAVALARDGAKAHAETLEKARQLLELLSKIPEVRGLTPACDDFLKWFHAGNLWISTVFVTDTQGRTVCGSLDNSRTLNISDRPHFLQAVQTGLFATSDLLIGRLSRRPIIATALPVFDNSGALEMVLGMGIDLTWIGRVASEANTKFGGVLLAMDSRGRVIVQQSGSPDAENGYDILPSPFAQSILKAKSPILETDDPEGVHRIYGIAQLNPSGAVIAIGLKRSDVLDPIEREFRHDFMLLLVVAISSIGAALLVAEFGLLRGVRTLKTAALRLKAGKMGLRVRLPGFVAAELHDLAATYNAMTAEFERLAYLDRLTGLPNRRYLERHLTERKERANDVSGRRQAVLAIDLDGFKPVNDTHGHAIGDKALTAIARRIAAVVDERGLLARVGGDEFVAIIPLAKEQGRQSARAFGEEIRAAFTQPFEVEGLSFPIGCSIGIALVPEDAHSLAGALVVADAALYEAKRTGRNRVIDNAPPLAAEGTEAGVRQPHWTTLEISGTW